MMLGHFAELCIEVPGPEFDKALLPLPGPDRHFVGRGDAGQRGIGRGPRPAVPCHGTGPSAHSSARYYLVAGPLLEWHFQVNPHQPRGQRRWDRGARLQPLARRSRDRAAFQRLP